MPDNIPSGTSLDSSSERLDRIRKELDDKIEHKISHVEFYKVRDEFRWVVGLLFIVVCGLLTIVNNKVDSAVSGIITKVDSAVSGINTKIDNAIDGVNTKIDNAKEQITIMETKFGFHNR